MQTIDLTQDIGVVEILLKTGVVRIQAEKLSDVIQLDRSSNCDQTASAGSDYMKLTRRLKPIHN